jgi:hypothetical protein
MGDGDDEPRRYTKAWVRANYDFGRETAPPAVQLVKLGHEWHITAVSAFVGLCAMIAFRFTGAAVVESVFASAGVFGYSFKIFFGEWWCSTLAETGSSEAESDATSTDAETVESEAETTQEQRQ